MKANEQTLVKENAGTPSEIWRVDGVGNCGLRSFHDLVFVIEPLSKNPGILVAKPLGLRGVTKALKLIKAERKKLGLTTLR